MHTTWHANQSIPVPTLYRRSNLPTFRLLVPICRTRLSRIQICLLRIQLLAQTCDLLAALLCFPRSFLQTDRGSCRRPRLGKTSANQLDGISHDLCSSHRLTRNDVETERHGSQ